MVLEIHQIFQMQMVMDILFWLSLPVLVHTANQNIVCRLFQIWIQTKQQYEQTWMEEVEHGRRYKKVGNPTFYYVVNDISFQDVHTRLLKSEPENPPLIQNWPICVLKPIKICIDETAFPTSLTEIAISPPYSEGILYVLVFKFRAKYLPLNIWSAETERLLVIGPSAPRSCLFLLLG